MFETLSKTTSLLPQGFPENISKLHRRGTGQTSQYYERLAVEVLHLT